MDFIKSKKDKDLLLYQGYTLSKRKVLAGGETVWECTKRRNEHACSVTVKSLNGVIVPPVFPGGHDHAPDPDEIEVLRARSAMKRRAMKRNVQQLGLGNIYQNDLAFRTNIKIISALDFVPVANVVRDFNTLAAQCGLAEQPVLDYFENTYIGQPQRARRNDPIFSPDLWNINSRVTRGLPRTTNSVEGWHNKFNRSLGVTHPSIWKFIEVLQNDSAANHLSIAQQTAGQAVPPQKRKYRVIDQQIADIVGDYGNRNIINFLRGISYNLAF